MNRPKYDNYVMGPLLNKTMILKDLHGFKRPIENTKENIFPNENEDIPKLKIKVKRNEKLKRKKMFPNKYSEDIVGGIISPKANNITKKMPSKPCNNDYRVVNDEAKKNAHVRYYFECNYSQFNIN